jgi:hypothetical protein
MYRMPRVRTTCRNEPTIWSQAPAWIKVSCCIPHVISWEFVIPGGGPGLIANEADNMTIPKKPIMAMRIREAHAVMIFPP